MVSAMKIADTKSEASLNVRVNPSGRRTFSREYKLGIIRECSAPGASVAAVALSHRINANQVRKWIVRHRGGHVDAAPRDTPAMLPVTLRAMVRSSPPAESVPVPRSWKAGSKGVIEVDFDGARIRVRGAVDALALRTIVEALAQR